MGADSETTGTKDHTRCFFSTSIAGHVTAGRGKLEWTGEWEFPCQECAERLNRRLECSDAKSISNHRLDDRPPHLDHR